MILARETIPAFLVPCLCSFHAAAQAPCTGDLNADRNVDGVDLGVLLGEWGGSGPADLNADGSVDGVDLGVLLACWGACPTVTPDWAVLVRSDPDPAIVTDPWARQRIVATGWAWHVCDAATQIEMVLIPPGSFAMGCTPSTPCPPCDCAPYWRPQHDVTLTRALYVGRFEVTQSQWMARTGTNPSEFQGGVGSDRHPVEQVSWSDVQGFLLGTGLRLLSEAESEYAYRGGTVTRFHGFEGHPSGTDDIGLLGQIAWFGGNNGTPGSPSYGTKVVGTKLANGFGLHDMEGNVSEWVNDWSGWYSSDPATDPLGPDSGSSRAIRGGAWNASPTDCSAYARRTYAPWGTFGSLGFRVARAP